jgi:acetoin utilization deacetylase AcuC-like enzyme
MNRLLIYTDRDFAHLHNPDFGSSECGERINLDRILDEDNKRLVITPSYNKKIELFMTEFCKNNPIFNLIQTQNMNNPFRPNLFQQLFNMIPSKFYDRNCHGCTVKTNKTVCPICESKISIHNYFTFVHTHDPNVTDADTTHLTHTTYTAVTKSVNLVCEMITDLYNKKINHGFALVRPPGHHASKTKSEGFCIVNNVAIGAEYGLKLGFKRIFIFDFDAHHGNGTQEIFYDRADVFYCSIHTLDTWPKTGQVDETGNGLGQGYNLNIIVKKGVYRYEYLKKFHTQVIPAIKSFDPDLIIISAGFDGLSTDRMKIMNLDPETYEIMTETLVNLNKPLAFVLEGGYDQEALPIVLRMCIEKLK